MTIITIAAMGLIGQDAEAQARGTLQATATVVDTRQGFEALAAVRQQLTDRKIHRTQSVATVAQISAAKPATKPSGLVVTIDYSRN